MIHVKHIAKLDFTTKFHLLDGTVEGVENFESPIVLTTSPIEPYNCHVKKANRCRYQRHQSITEEAVKLLENNPLCGEPSIDSKNNGRFLVMQTQKQTMSSGAFLVQDQVRTTVQTLENSCRGELLLGREGNVGMQTVKLFQNGMIETFIRLVRAGLEIEKEKREQLIMKL